MYSNIDFLKELAEVLKMLDTPMEYLTAEEVERKFPKYGSAICKYLRDQNAVKDISFCLKEYKNGQIKLLYIDTLKKIEKMNNSIEDRRRQKMTIVCNLLTAVFTGVTCIIALSELIIQCKSK